MNTQFTIPHLHNEKPVKSTANVNIHAPATAKSERIPTTTWGTFTIVVVVFLLLLVCFILNCGRIRRRVNQSKITRRSGPFSFEKRHKDLQEADLEWNNHPPIVFTSEKITVPESAYSGKSNISSSTSSTSKHSSLSSSEWSTAGSTIAQKHHYTDKNFIKHQPPSVQLRLTLESASSSSLHTTTATTEVETKPYKELPSSLV